MEEIRRIGDYRIVRELSRSSIASVYEGHQPSLDRRVLIKRLHPELVGDADIRARFEREARALARIKHKNIVHIYDYQASEDSVHLIAEWIAGGSLEKRLKEKGTLSEREAVALALDLLEGLSVAFQAGIIHRDIKPANLLVSHSGAIKITDFGLAQFEGSPSVTLQGMVVGTPAYLAPEVVAGQPADIRGDLYATGVTLYELMTGVNPFLADNISETLSRIMNLNPDPLEGVSHVTQELLFWLLEKKPEKRPATPDEALVEFRELAVQHDIERGWADIEATGFEAGDGHPVEDSPEAGAAIRPRPRPKPKISWVYSAWAAMLITIFAVFAGIPKFFVPERMAVSDSLSVENLIDDPSSVQVVKEETVPGKGETVISPVTEQTEQRDTVSPSENAEKSQEITTASEDRLFPVDDGSADSQVGSNDVEEEIVVAELASGNTTASDKPLVSKTDVGYLMLNVDPWANIHYQGRFRAQTPFTRPLKLIAGQIELHLSNPDLHLQSVAWQFDIPPGDTLRARVDLMSLVGVIRHIDASPWATVYVDGELIGDTPINREIFFPFGSHEFRFVNPNLPEKIEIIELAPDDPPKTIRIRLN